MKDTLMPWGLNMQKGARYAKGRATGVMLFTGMICYIGLKQDIKSLIMGRWLGLWCILHDNYRVDGS